MPVITSLQNPTIKLIRSLAERKYREETGLFVAEGEHFFARADVEDWVPEYLVCLSGHDTRVTEKRLQVSPEVMAVLSTQKNPPGLLGVFRQRWTKTVEPEGTWLALEDMRDPGNLGTIIRTADAVAAKGVILAGSSCDPWGPDCVRATAGSIFQMRLVRMSVASLIDLTKTWSGESVGTHLRASEDFRRIYRSPTLIVMGSEGKGLSDSVADACSTLVRIPMKGGAQSLNVAVAAGLMLYEIGK